MRKLALLLVAFALIAGDASASVFGYNVFGSGASSVSNANKGVSFIGSRAPSPDDDYLHGYVNGDYWNDLEGNGFYRVSDTTYPAIWEPMPRNKAMPGDVVSTGLVFAGGTMQMLVSYTGPLLDIRGNSGNTYSISSTTERVMDVKQAASLVAQSNTLAGVSATVSKIYDQTGFGNHVSQTTVAKQVPWFGLTINDIPAITFDGLYRQNAYASSAQIYNNSLPVQTNNMTACLIGRAVGNRYGGSIVSWGYPTATVAWGNSPDFGLSLQPTPTGQDGRTKTLAIKSTMSVICGRITSNTITWNQDDSSRTIAVTPVSASSTGFVLGSTTSATIASRLGGGSFDLVGFLVWNRVLTDNEIDSFKQAAYINANIIPQRRKQLVCLGDSITAGWGARFNLANCLQVREFLGNDYTVGIDGWPGSTVSNWLVLNNNGRMAYYEEQAKLNTPSIYVLALGTNDIAAGKSGDNLYVSYTTVLGLLRVSSTAVATTSNTANVQLIGAATIIPRSTFTTSQTIEAQRFNSLVRNNSAGADFIVDYESDPIISATSTASTYFYQDGTHPTEHGYSIMARDIWNAIRKRIP